MTSLKELSEVSSMNKLHEENFRKYQAFLKKRQEEAKKFSDPLEKFLYLYDFRNRHLPVFLVGNNTYEATRMKTFILKHHDAVGEEDLICIDKDSLYDVGQKVDFAFERFIVHPDVFKKVNYVQLNGNNSKFFKSYREHGPDSINLREISEMSKISKSELITNMYMVISALVIAYIIYEVIKQWN